MDSRLIFNASDLRLHFLSAKSENFLEYGPAMQPYYGKFRIFIYIGRKGRIGEGVSATPRLNMPLSFVRVPRSVIKAKAQYLLDTL